MIAYYMPDIIGSTLYVLTHLIHSIILWDRYHYYLPFTDEKTEAYIFFKVD